MRILVALDQGTTSSRAIVFDEAGHTLASHAIEFKQHYPRPGWVEHDPDDILGTQVEALQKAVKMSKVDVRDIAAIGITNQRETTLLWEKDTAAAYTTPSCGSAAAPRPMWRSWCARGMAKPSGKRRALCRTPTSAGRSWRGCWIR